MAAENFGTVTEQFPIGSTRYGKVIGENRQGAAVFRGIPYGGRCDRERRFLPPQEPECWDGVRDCTKNGPICVQTAGSSSDFYSTAGHLEKYGLQYETQDENCLCLNVLTPGMDGKKRPVLVYIHGGGYSILSGTIALGSDKLVREQDVVVVSMNHRLHVFGYLYLGGLDERYRDSGNVGHLDLILALRWVRDNIAAFGGDPDCVTIMGESGGSEKVLALTHMPEAKGLFHRAIAISSFLPAGRTSPERATAYTRQVLKLLDVPENHLERLQELPARYITNTVYAPETKLWSLTFGPVADGIHLGYGLGAGYVPQDPSVPLLVGSSEEEMANFTLESGLDITWDNFRQKLLERGKNFGLPVTEENVDGLIDAFRRGNTKNDPPDHLFMKMISLKCHMGVAQNVAEDYAAQKRGPVFLYLNRYDAPNGGHPYRRFAGHCIELCPFFRVVAYPEMEEYSKQVAALFCAFMRTGDPSVEGLAWPAFTLENRAVMQFDRVFSVARDPVQGERAALDAVCGHHGVANAFTRQGYQYDQDLVPPSER